jgi:thioredoxin-dependent peroxiredoxin
MRLKAGQDAPDFHTETWQGEAIRLADWEGQKLWLAFFRYASCPLCNMRVHRMRQRFEELSQAGLRIISVFQSPVERIRNHVGAQQPPFELVADPELDLYELYGVETSLTGFLDPRNLKPLREGIAMGYSLGKMDGPKTRVPADFLIDTDQTIHTAFYGDLVSDHIDFARVEDFVAS